jgi:ribosomal protein L11 methylase PrmA
MAILHRNLDEWEAVLSNLKTQTLSRLTRMKTQQDMPEREWHQRRHARMMFLSSVERSSLYIMKQRYKLLQDRLNDAESVMEFASTILSEEDDDDWFEEYKDYIHNHRDGEPIPAVDYEDEEEDVGMQVSA